MLNLSFVFDDAVNALAVHAERLSVLPLPATVYMMQVDVINHYQYAMDHYLTLTLEELSLQKSSLGTPYQKWAYFTNQDFGMLSFAVHNLLRYTSRLIHETECKAHWHAKRFTERKNKSNSYTAPISEIRHRNKSIGVTVHDDHCLEISAIRIERGSERVIARQTVGSPTCYFRVIHDADGSDHEVPIGLEEFERAVEVIKAESIDIRDRSHLATIRARGLAEIAGLRERNQAFAELCNRYYQSQRVAEPFDCLNESYWI